MTSIYKKYYADPVGYLLQDAKYAAIVKIKDEKRKYPEAFQAC